MSNYNDNRRWRPTDEEDDFDYEEQGQRGFRRDDRSRRESRDFAQNFIDDYGNEREDEQIYGEQSSGRRYGSGGGSRQYGGRDSGYGQHRNFGREMGGNRGEEDENYGGGIRSSGGFGGQSERSTSNTPRTRYQRGYNNSDYQKDADYGYGANSGSFGGSNYGYNPDPRSARQDYGNAFRPTGQRYGQGQHSGKGPQGYQRGDDRIREDINDRLTWHGDIDATHITVKVENGEVTLEGNAQDRNQKRLAEDIAESVRGVKEVHNHLRVNKGLFEQIGDQINDLLNRE
jgi:hypothetical protein